MSKRVNNVTNDDDETINDIEIIEDKITNMKDIIMSKLEEDICEVVWVKEKSFGINFKGYGITFIIDSAQKIGNTIKIQYEGEIEKPNFKAYPIFE